MPKKQTRETIEAELSDTETERLIEIYHELIREAEEVEALLRQVEKERELPSCPAKPLVERMAQIGMSQATIDRIGELFDAMTKLVEGKITVGELDRVRQGKSKAPNTATPPLEHL